MPEHLLESLRHPALIKLMAHIHQPAKKCIICIVKDFSFCLSPLSILLSFDR